MPTKAKEKPAKRIQSVSKRERMKPANVAPEKPKNAPESFTDAFKRRDEQGAGRNSRLMLKHLEKISIRPAGSDFGRSQREVPLLNFADEGHDDVGGCRSRKDPNRSAR